MSVPPEDQDPTLRAAIGAKLQEHVTPEQLDELMTEVLAITKGARGWCPKCQSSVQVTIPDAKAVVGAMSDLANQSWGRPGDGREGGGAVVNFTRKIIYNGGADDAA